MFPTLVVKPAEALAVRVFIAAASGAIDEMVIFEIAPRQAPGSHAPVPGPYVDLLGASLDGRLRRIPCGDELFEQHH